MARASEPVEEAPISEAECWKQLYGPVPPAEKIQVASSLLASAVGDGRREAIWLFEWLCSGAGVLSKKAALPTNGVVLLCKLLEALPSTYLLVPSTPLLVAQLRAFIGTVERSADFDSKEGIFTAYLRLLSLLLVRPVESFRPSVEQVLPLLSAAAGSAAACISAKNASADELEETIAGDREIDSHLLLVAGLARMLGRALEYVNAKKAFKTVLDALPSLATLASHAPEDSWASCGQENTEVAQPRMDTAPARDAGDALQLEDCSTRTIAPWPQVLSAIHRLLLALVEPRHLDGYEALARVAGSSATATSPAEESQEPPQKRARKDKDKKVDDSGTAAPGSAYQTTLFKCVGELLGSASSRHGCIAMLPILFKAFVLQYRRHTVFRGAFVSDVGNSQDAGSTGSKKRSAPQVDQPTLPCEFSFFLQISESLSTVLHATAHSESVFMVHCLVQLWHLVREHGVYRPREDPKRMQAQSLESFCEYMLCRLAGDDGRSRAALRRAARVAPEWDGLVEALALDPTPFESRLERMWSVIGDMCPEADGRSGDTGEKHETSASSHAGLGRDVVPCVRFATALLHTYARLADLQSCLQALISTFRSGPRRRAKCLLSDLQFLRGFEVSATEVSVGSAPSQAMSVWKDLLSELQEDSCASSSQSAPKEARLAGETWWAAKMLQHIVQGIRVQELSVEPFRELLLESFQFFGTSRARELPQIHVDGLMLSFCTFGRRLIAWDLPRVLRRPQDEGAALREEVTRGLGRLAQMLAQSSGTPAPESWEPYVQASVQWLALLEQESAGQGTKLETRRVVSGLFHLAMPARGEGVKAPPLDAQLEARRTICNWVGLLTGQAVRCDDEADADERSCVSPLVNVLVPKPLACWRYLERVWEKEDIGTSTSSERSEKLWSPAAALWAERVDILVEQPVLRTPILQRLAGLVTEVTTEDDGGQVTADNGHGGSKRDQLRRCSALLGLISALLRVLAWAHQALSTELLLPLVRAVAAAGMLACGACSDTGNTGTNNVPARLLAAALLCLSRLLEPVAMEGPNLDVVVAEEAVTLLAGVGERGKASAPMLTSAVATLLAAGGAAACSQQLAGALSGLARTLLRQRVNAWPLKARQKWLAALVKKLVSPGLVCSQIGGEQACLEVSLPSPWELLATAESTSASGGSFIQVERALRLLLSFLQGSKPQGGVNAELATSASLEGALRISLSAAEDIRCTPSERLGDQQCLVAGLALAVLAQCTDRAGRRSITGSEVQSGVTQSLLFHAGMDDGAAGQRQAALDVISPVIRCLQARGHMHPTYGEGLNQLHLGLSSQIGALCGSWPAAADDDLWRTALVPLVLDWTEMSEGTGSTEASNSAIAGATLDGPPKHGSATHCCDALCAGVGRDRREYVVQCLARRAAVFAMRGTEDKGIRPAALLAIVGGLATVLRGMPHRPPLRISAANEVIVAVHGLLALGAAGPHAHIFSGCVDDYARFLLCISDVVLGLYVHLAAPLQHRSRANEKKDPHRKLADTEALLLGLAGLLARSALQLGPGQAPDRSNGSTGARAAVSESAVGALDSGRFESLATAAYSLMSALFGAVPAEGGARLPTWTRKPHVVLDVLKVLLETVYICTRGAQAARIASDTARLWEAYAQGGTRLVAQSAGRTGQSTYQAKVQRATRGFVIMLIAHALEQQRRWAGVEAAALRSLRFLRVQQPDAREAARHEELARWKEAVTVLEQGMVSLLTSLEGSEHLKQSLYAGLREPLSTMFKELHENYQKHSRYQGKA